MSYSPETEALEQEIKQAGHKIELVFAQVQRRIVGQSHVAQRLLMALLTQGHVLLEGLPGLAKTTSIKAVADATGLDYKRIQFTPDLLPADVVGTQVYDPRDGNFLVKKGPVFTNLLLADEINRAPAKVQSALLEAMQEKQVTIGDQTFSLPKPFLVMATQNPVEQEGTYPLPEAQVDRFLFKVLLTYGSLEDEQEIIKRVADGEEPTLEEVVHQEDLIGLQGLVNRIHVADKIRHYIASLVFATRDPEKLGLNDLANLMSYGASPRASIGLDRAARANALLEGRGFVTPQDVKDVGFDVLRHRIQLTYEAEADDKTADDILEKIFARVDVP